MAALVNSEGQTQCGGILINPDIVLTAAHCATFIDSGGFIQVGHHSLGEQNIETFTVRSQIFHPKFDDSKMLRYDFLLLFLERPSYHDPIQIINNEATVPSEGDIHLYVTGWGRTNEASPVSATNLQEVEVKYIDNEKCEASEGYLDQTGVVSYDGMIFEDHLCASDEGKDACYGDSGSPLIIKGSNDTDSNADVLIGIVSWGFACADSRFPGVYARVNTVYDWIRTTACTSEYIKEELFDCTNHSQSQDNKVNDNTVKEAKFSNAVLTTEVCTNDDECPSNSACTLYDNKCKLVNSEACFFSHECLYNNCNNGICDNGGLLIGMDCTNNNQCQSNKCKKSICVSSKKDKKGKKMKRKG